MRTFLTVILALVCAFTFAQKKPNINKAKSAMDKGELAEAKTIIDQAIEHEKTKDDAKTWYYRGMIYATLDTAMNEPGALETAVSSFNKSLELDPAQKSTSSFTGSGFENVDSNLQSYYAYYYNKGIVSYSSEQFDEAMRNFETSFYINPSDTNSILNAAFAASADENDEKAKAHFLKTYEVGSRDKSVLLQLYNFSVRDEDFENALIYIREGKRVYPEDTDFGKYEINLLIELDKVEEARDELLNAIELSPDNADLHFSLGVLQEELKEVENAISSYKKAISIDPNHYNSNFNLGVTIFNKSNELIKERNGLGYKETKKYDQLTVEINKQLKTALPVWEKLYTLKSDDRTVLETLSYIYTSLDMNDKANSMEDKLEALDN